MSKNVSLLVNDLEDSAVSSIISKAASAGWEDTIHLAGGEPKFPLYPNLLEKFINFDSDMISKYSPFLGYRELIELIRSKLESINKVKASFEEIIVVPGGSSALFSSLSVTINPGDEVLISNPCWEHYEKIIQLVRGIPKRFNLSYSNGRYEIDIENLKKNITEKTKVLLLNTPLNPIGSVLKKTEIQEIVNVCEKYGLWLIIDEEYETFVYDKNVHTSVRSLYDQAITLFSFSKSFALTGIRLGYITAPQKIINLLRRFGLYTYMLPPSPSQCMAISLMQGGSYVNYLTDVQKLYQQKMMYFFDLLKEIPTIQCWRPEGGVYLFPRLQTNQEDSAKILIEDYHLLCVPGNVSGSFGDNHVRFFLGADDTVLLAASQRLKEFMKKYGTNK